jgi:hypothetical protein
MSMDYILTSYRSRVAIGGRTRKVAQPSDQGADRIEGEFSAAHFLSSESGMIFGRITTIDIV